MKRVTVVLAVLMAVLFSFGTMAALDWEDYVGGIYFLNLEQGVLGGFTSTGMFDLIGGARFDNVTLATTLTITETNIAFVGAVGLTGDMVITSVLKGLDVDVTSAGADTNYFGIDNDVTQGSIASGAYLSRGNLIGAANSVIAIGNIDATYATYSSSTLAMTDDTEANQLYGGIFASNVSGAYTLAINDGVMGAQFAVEVAADVTDISTGSVFAGMVAAGFFFPNVLTPITATVYGAYIKCTNYTDYGLATIVESNNISAGIQIRTKDSAVLPIGLEFACTSGSITNDIALSGGQFIDSETLGAIVADKCTAVEYQGTTQKTVLTFTLTGDNDLDLPDGNHGTGIKVFDMPEGQILILGATINAVVVTSDNYNDTANDVFVVSMGTAVGADDATLTGTEVDIIPSTELDTVSHTSLTLDWHAALGASAQFDGTGTPKDLYVNAAIADASNTDANTYAITGTATITWINLGDY